MDLVDLIESHRFLGSEFMMWLWFRSEMHEGMIPLGDRKACEFYLDDRITLEADMVETEQSLLKGGAPASTPEAREALRQGKVPTQARVRTHYDGQEFVFTLKAGELQLSSVKIPAVLSKEEDEKFYERMYLMETLEGLLDHLYGEFLSVRLSPAWASVTEQIRVWVRSDATPSVDAYLGVVAGVVPLSRASSAATPSAD
jgi:hypothetical protein